MPGRMMTLTESNRETQWLEFKAKNDEPDKAPCPFCGIRHQPAKTHPFCDMATRFNSTISVN